MGITALMYAAMDGNVAEVKYLLDKGANPNIVCNVRALLFDKTCTLPDFVLFTFRLLRCWDRRLRCSWLRCATTPAS